MEQGLIGRIARLSKEYIPRMAKHGKTLDGPYWYGWYQENGKTKRVYIGKELPKELERLIKKRYKKPGFQRYTWPRARG